MKSNISNSAPELKAINLNLNAYDALALTKGIINKVLHTPVTNLRAPQPRQQRHQAMKVLQDLFELHESQD